MLILASGSTNRQQALTIARIPFRAVPANIDEKAIKAETIEARIQLIAKAKVDKVAASEKGLILGADGVNVCEGRLLEKPVTLEEAKEMLRFQSGKPAEFLTAYYLLNTQTNKVVQGVTRSSYRFRHLSPKEIDAYVTAEPVLNWAAAFSPLNSMAITFVEWMEGNPTQFCFSMPFDKIFPEIKASELTI